MADLRVISDGNELSHAGSSSTLLSFVSSWWSAASPSQLSVLGGQEVTFSGEGLAASEALGDVVMRMVDAQGERAESAACHVTDEQVRCVAPCWALSAGRAQVDLLAGGRRIAKAGGAGGGAGVVTLAEAWTGLGRVAGSVLGGEALAVYGNGFAVTPQAGYTCQFRALAAAQTAAQTVKLAVTVEGEAVAVDTITCTTPAWGAEEEVEVVLLRRGERVPLLTDSHSSGSRGCAGTHAENPSGQFRFTAAWSHAEPALLRPAPQASLLVRGAGFARGSAYTCVLVSLHRPHVRLLSEAAEVQAPGVLRCSWDASAAGEASPFSLSLLQDAHLLRHTRDEPWVVSFVASSQPLQAEWVAVSREAPSHGRAVVTVIGRGFEVDTEYKCRYRRSDGQGEVKGEEAADFVSTVALLCPVPRLPEEEEGRVWLELRHGAQLVPRAAAAGPDPGLQLYAVWWFEEDHAPLTTGGGSIEVAGAGFSLKRRYELVLSGADWAGRLLTVLSEPALPDSSALLRFTAPAWRGYEQTVTARLRTTDTHEEVRWAGDEGSDQASGVVRYVGSWAQAQDSGKRLAGSVSGGSALELVRREVVVGLGTSGVCRFSRGNVHHSTPVQFHRYRPDMTCMAPRWEHGMGEVNVSVVLEEQGRSTVLRAGHGTDHLTFDYLADITGIDGTTFLEGGLRISVAGRGFASRDAKCVMYSTAVATQSCNATGLTWNKEDVVGMSNRAVIANGHLLCDISWVVPLSSNQVFPDQLGADTGGVPSVRIAIVDASTPLSAVGAEHWGTWEGELQLPVARWSVAEPLVGPALGRASLSVSAWGLQAGERLVVRFSREGRVHVDSAAVTVTAGQVLLRFETPRVELAGWWHVALMSLERGLIAFAGENAAARYWFQPAWVGVHGMSGPASGGTLVTLEGHGFDARAGDEGVECVFSLQEASWSTQGHVLDGERLTCPTPACGAEAGLARVSLRMRGEEAPFVGAKGRNTFRFIQGWSGLDGGEQSVLLPAHRTTLLTLQAHGLQSGASDYWCVFIGEEERRESQATVPSSNTLTCPSPDTEDKGWAGAAELQVRHGSQLLKYSGAAPVEVRFHAMVHEAVADHALTNAPCKLRIRASGLDTSAAYVCTATVGLAAGSSAVASEATYPQDSATLVCVLPAWQAPAANAAVQVLDGAGRPLQSTTPLAIAYSPSWSSVLPRSVSAVGGQRLTLEVSGLGADTECTCSFTHESSSVAVTVHSEWSESGLECVLPWLLRSAGSVIVHLNVGSGDSTLRVPFVGADQDDELQMTPVWRWLLGEARGSVAGGQAVILHGGGFSMAGVYRCRFGSTRDTTQVAHSAPISPTDSTAIQCTSPVWEFGEGLTDVAIVDDAKGTSLLGVNPAQFAFTAEWVALELSYSAMSGKLVAEVAGSGFVKGGAERYICDLVDIDGACGAHAQQDAVVQSSGSLRCEHALICPKEAAAARFQVAIKRADNTVVAFVGESGGDVVLVDSLPVQRQVEATRPAPRMIPHRPSNSELLFEMQQRVVTVLEDSGWHSVAHFLTNPTCGGSIGRKCLEGGEYVVDIREGSEIFSSQSPPRINDAGSLVFGLEPDSDGDATLQVVLCVTRFAGCSAPQTFEIRVAPVNDAPTFRFAQATTISVSEDAHSDTPFSMLRFVADIAAEPRGVTTQQVSFEVSAAEGDAGLFTQAPRIDHDGRLTFRTARDANGKAAFLVSLVDSGGTDDGGFNQSSSEMFWVHVTPVNDAPSFTLDAAAMSISILEDEYSLIPFSRDGVASSISAGPGNEQGQSLSFIVSSAITSDDSRCDMDDLFFLPPHVDRTGALSFQTRANKHGSCLLSIVLLDAPEEEPAALRQVSAAASLLIIINPVNDAPLFDLEPVAVCVEDGGNMVFPGQAFNLQPEPLAEKQSVSFILSLEQGSSLLFRSSPLISSDGTLHFELSPDQNGVAVYDVRLRDNGGIFNGGVDQSEPSTLQIRIESVNDAPQFSLPSPYLKLLEDSPGNVIPGFALNVRPGPDITDENMQTVSFLVVASNGFDVFTRAISISARGDLEYALIPDANGIASFDVVLQDDGSTNEDRGDKNVSLPVTVTVEVIPVNDKPTFVLHTSLVTVFEDSPAQSLPFVGSASPGGGPDELWQALSFSLVEVAETTNLFAKGLAPRVGRRGTLEFELAAHAFGKAEFDIVLTDDGGTMHNGVDEAAAQRIVIDVLPVNDPPSFVLLQSRVIVPDRADTPGVVVANFAKSIVRGPNEEQAVTFALEVVSGSRRLFSAEPTIDEAGQLSFALHPDADGSATYSVLLLDSGGRRNGGANQSTSANFTISTTAPSISSSVLQSSAPPTTTPIPGPRLEFTASGTATTSSGHSYVRFVLSEDQTSGFPQVLAVSPENAGFAVIVQPLRYRIFSSDAWTESGSDAVIFSATPSIGINDGTLAATLRRDRFGEVMYRISLVNASVGVNTTVVPVDEALISLQVDAVNDPPFFRIAQPVVVLSDDADLFEFSDVIDGITAGGWGENGTSSPQSFSFNSDFNTTLFTQLTVVCPDGSQCDGGVADVRGRALNLIVGDSTVRVTLRDNAGGSYSNSFIMRIIPRDVPPSFRIASSVPCDLLTTRNYGSSCPSQSSLFRTMTLAGASGTPADCVIETPRLCEVPLSFYKDSSCVGGFRWSEIFWDAQALRTLEPIPFGDLTCNREDDDGVFNLTQFALPLSGAGVPDSSGNQTFTFEVAAISNPYMFLSGPNILPDGTLMFTVDPDFYGEITFNISLREFTGLTSPIRTFSLRIVQRNQDPFFRLHDIVVFERSGFNVIPGAAFAISPGNSIGSDGIDLEASQVVSFRVVVSWPELFDGTGGGFPAVLQDGTLTLRTKEGMFGSTEATVTATDNEGASFSSTCTITLRHVNSAPAFALVEDVFEVQEDANCRSHYSWFQASGRDEWFAPSGCPTTVPNVFSMLAAGLDNEACLNCAQSTPCVMSDVCESQSISFVLDDVSDASLFHILPSLSPDGALRFSLNPDASGKTRVVMRAVDDGGILPSAWFQLPGNASQMTPAACTDLGLTACGPGGDLARTLSESGTDTSAAVEFSILVRPVNDPPSFQLARTIECEHTEHVCTCPSDQGAVLDSDICKQLPPGANASIRVLEDSDSHAVQYFASHISSSASIVGGMGTFDFDDVSGDLNFSSLRKDPILGSAGLEFATSYALSPNQTHLYTAEFGTDTVGILDHTKGDLDMLLLDRRGEGEERFRFYEHQRLDTEDPCSVHVAGEDGEVFVGVAQGCEQLSENKEYLPSHFAGDAGRTSPADYTKGFLWQQTVGFWQFSSEFAGGLLQRAAARTSLCEERNPAFVNPAGISDSRGNFPRATMGRRGAACRANTYSDVPVGSQPTLLNFFANNGEHEGLQFDGSLLNGLWVETDLDRVLPHMPRSAFSIEIWFSVYVRPPSVAFGGLLSAQSGPGNTAKGFSLYYRFCCVGGCSQVSCEPNQVFFILSMSTEGDDSRPKTYQRSLIKADFVNNWQHLAVTYDGTSVKFYINGTDALWEETTDMAVSCGLTTCPVSYPICGWDGARCRDPLTRLARPATFVLGAIENAQSGFFYTHQGAMLSVKLLKTAMTRSQTAASYRYTVAGLTQFSPRYWSKVHQNDYILPSPSINGRSQLNAHTSAGGQTLTVMGKFSSKKLYRCRWSVNDLFVDSSDAELGNLVDFLGKQTCSGRITASDEADVTCGSRSMCCDPGFANKLVCRIPSWGYGYKATWMSIVESAGVVGEDSIPWSKGSIPLWQKTCLQEVCGFSFLSNLLFLPDIAYDTLWWLNLAVEGPSRLQQQKFALNRGDRTMFIFRTKTSFRRFDVSSELMAESTEIQGALGVSSMKTFTPRDGNQYLALANYWDGKSTSTTSAVVEFSPLYNKSALVQIVPTRGATAFEYFQIGNSGQTFEFIAVSNFVGPSNIFPWVRSEKSVHSITIVKPGQGYRTGTLKVLDNPAGVGFAADFDVAEVGVQSKLHLYQQKGGELVCTVEGDCVRIVNNGRGYTSDDYTGFKQGQFAYIEPDCLDPCDPLALDPNCTSSPLPRCWRSIVHGRVEIYYGLDCAVDNRACTGHLMSDTISDTILMPMTDLPGSNEQKAETSIGHTRRCLRPGQFTHSNPNGDDLLVRYNVNADGQIGELYFPTARNHGSNYLQVPGVYTEDPVDPGVVGSDTACHCGTTATDVRVINRGTGYTSGTLSLDGVGSGFFATYNVLGNLTEVVVDDGGRGFSSVPRISVVSETQYGQNGRGAAAQAVMGIKEIALLSRGSRYTVPPTIILQNPSGTVDGRAAMAIAVLGPPDGANFSYVERIEVIDSGLGFTSVPLVTIVDGPGEVGNRWLDPDHLNASAIALLFVERIAVNHVDHFNLLAPSVRDSFDYQLLLANWDTWFTGRPDASLSLSGDETLSFNGISGTVAPQYLSALRAPYVRRDFMTFVCSSCIFSNATARYQIDSTTLLPYDGVSNYTDVDEPTCLSICLQLPRCTAVHVGTAETENQCWISTESADSSNGLWGPDGALNHAVVNATFRTFVRQAGNVSVYPSSAVDLLCRPRDAPGIASPDAECHHPFRVVNVPFSFDSFGAVVSEATCCLDPDRPVTVTVQTSSGEHVLRLVDVQYELDPSTSARRDELVIASSTLRIDQIGSAGDPIYVWSSNVVLGDFAEAVAMQILQNSSSWEVPDFDLAQPFQTGALDAGCCFGSEPDITMSGDNGNGLEAGSSSATAILGIKEIVLLNPGSKYSVPPTIILQAPPANNLNVPAKAVAILGPPDAMNFSSIERIDILDGGLGFLSVPSIQIVDGPGEVASDAGLRNATAMVLLGVRDVRVTLSVGLQTALRTRINIANWERWYPGQQNAQYSQEVAEDDQSLSGLTLDIPIQHSTTLGSVSEMDTLMTLLCEGCNFEPHDGRYLLGIVNETINAVGQVANSMLWDSYIGMSEERCRQACVSDENCRAVTVGVNGTESAGQCWFEVLRSPDVDTLWQLHNAPFQEQSINSFSCRDDETWLDIGNRTCEAYFNLSFCSFNSTNGTAGPNYAALERYFEVIREMYLTNATNMTDLNSTMNAESLFRLNATNGTDTLALFYLLARDGVSALDACCYCGRPGPAYKVFVKQNGNITLHPKSVSDLLCRPAEAPFLSSDTAACHYPYTIALAPRSNDDGTIMRDANGMALLSNRCCLDPSSGAVKVAIGSTTLNVTDVRYETEEVIADGLLVPRALRGAANDLVEWSMTRQAYSTPYVIGTIDQIAQETRGTNYTDEPSVIVTTFARPEYHNRSLWIDETRINRYSFTDATFSVTIGFPSTVDGAFDGTNLDYLCSLDQARAGLCSRSTPFGDGFGPCITVVRAFGAELAAGTGAMDYANQTKLETTGASAMASFSVDGQVYLAVANYFDESKVSLPSATNPSQLFSAPSLSQSITEARRTKSPLYRLSIGADGLEVSTVQEFDTFAANDVRYFEIDGRHFLLFAQDDGPVSPLFSWSSNAGQFELIQNVATQQAKSIHPIDIELSDRTIKYLVAAQIGGALQCSIADQLTPNPRCGQSAPPEGQLAGISALGPALTEDGFQGNSVMFRWNGTTMQSVNTPLTLPKDLAGGQVFISNSSTDFVSFRAGANTYALLLNSEADKPCRDNPYWVSDSGLTCAALNGSDGCISSRGYFCDACPLTCGTCSRCNDQFEAYSRGSCSVQDVASLTAFGFPASIGETCADAACSPEVNNCMICPQTCGTCAMCKDESLGRAGVTYGFTVNTESIVFKAKQEDKLLGLKGVNSIVVSSDGRHVYASSLFARSVVAFDRNPSTGLLIYNAELGITQTVPQDGETWPFPACNYSHDCLRVGFGRPYQGLAQISITDDGMNLYGVSSSFSAVYIWQRDTASGALSLLRLIADGMIDGSKLVDGLQGASSLFISHNSHSVYVTGSRDQSVAAFHRESDGDLTFIDRIKNGERRFDQYPVSPPDVTAANISSQFPMLLSQETSARAVRYFVMDGEQYLAIAFGADTILSSEAVGYAAVLKWDGQSFVEKQRTTLDKGPVDLEHMYIINDVGDGLHFLAVANSDESPASSAVNIYQWDPQRQEFFLHHALPRVRPDGEPLHTLKAVPRGICYLRASQIENGAETTQHFLAVAYHQDVSSAYDMDSYVFAWQHEGQTVLGNGTILPGTGFVAYQRMVATGATDFVALEVPCSASNPCSGGSLQFLAVSSFGNPSSVVSTSPVWRYKAYVPNTDPDNFGLWNSLGSPGFFERVQEIQTTGAASVHSFHIPHVGYFLAFAERQTRFSSTNPDDYGGRVSIWQVNERAAASCTLSAGTCFQLHQAIDGVTTDGGSSDRAHQPGKSVPAAGNYSACSGEPCGTQRMIGATSLKFFSANGEHYLAIAQSVCPLFAGLSGCSTPDDLQPQSSVLQWNRGLALFTELLSITDAANTLLRGAPLSDSELLYHSQLHSFAFRLPILRAASWESLEVTPSSPGHNRSLLVSTSLHGGVVAYLWQFETITGLNGSASVTALLAGTTFAPVQTGMYDFPEFGVPSFENLFSVPVVSLSPEQQLATDGIDENVYVAAAMDRSLVHAKRVHATDSVGNRVAEFSLLHTYQQFTPEQSASRDMVEGLNNPLSLRFFLQPVVSPWVPETNSSSARRLLQEGEVPPAYTLTYKPQLAVMSKESEDERMCGFVSNGPCQTVSMLVVQVSGMSGMFDQPPAISKEGLLSFTLKPTRVGIATFQVNAFDSNQTNPNTSVVLSGPRFFSITVLPVNDAPDFDAVNIYAPMDAGLQALIFAVNVTSGVTLRFSELDLVGEAGKLTWNYAFTAERAILSRVYTDQPFIMPPNLNVSVIDDMMYGVITFETLRGWFGDIFFDLDLSDDGPASVATGAQNRSTLKNFTLSIRYVNDRPFFTARDVHVNGTRPDDAAVPVSVVAASEITVCNVPPDPVSPLLFCNEMEWQQTYTFFVIDAEGLSGNIPAQGGDILGSSGGVFLPPVFEATCDGSSSIDGMILSQEASARDELGGGALQSRLDALSLIPSFESYSKTWQPALDMRGIDAVAREEKRLADEFCSECYELSSRCIGVCLDGDCMGGSCDDDVLAGGNCDGRCAVAECNGRFLQIHTPVFSTDPLEEMTFSLVPGVYGTARLKIAMVDSGGIANGGNDTTIHTLTLTIVRPRVEPEIRSRRTIRLLESSELFNQTLADVIDFDPGTFEAQVFRSELAFVDGFDGGLFWSPPRLSADLSLLFTLNPFVSGGVRIMVSMIGEGSDPPMDTTLLNLVVIPVNHPPSCNLPEAAFAVEDAGPLVIQRFASELSAGDEDEHWQTLTLGIAFSNDPALDASSRLFVDRACAFEEQCEAAGCLPPNWQDEGSAGEVPPHSQLHAQAWEARLPCAGQAPTIDHDGTLRLQTARDQHGTVQLSITLQDDGGVAYGGQDTAVGGPVVVPLRVLPQPRVLAVTPRIGSAAGGNVVTIRGAFFGSIYSRGYYSPAYSFRNVSIGGRDCASVTYVSDSEILCTPAPGVGSGAAMVVIEDDAEGQLFLTSTQRAGALPAAAAYTHAEVAVGATEKAFDVFDDQHGLLAFGPSSMAPGSVGNASASVRRGRLSLSGQVEAMVVKDGLLFVGGSWTAPPTSNASDAPGAFAPETRRLFRYDGDSPQPLGIGPNGDVFALAVYRQWLVAGGSFTAVLQDHGARVDSGGLALWSEEGSEWSVLPNTPEEGLTGVVLSAAAYEHNLYVGGRFDRFRGSLEGANGIIMYDGREERWKAVGSGLQGGKGEVLALLAVCESESGRCGNQSETVYAGGAFQQAGVLSTSNIARWDGVSWQRVGALNGPVYALAAMGGWIYAGGAFTAADFPGGFAVAEHLARWRGGEWRAVKAGTSHPVYALQAVGSCMYLAGSFAQVCDEAEGVVPAASCAEEEDERALQTANGLARVCFASDGSPEHTDEAMGRWEPLETHGISRLSKAKALASYMPQ